MKKALASLGLLLSLFHILVAGSILAVAQTATGITISPPFQNIDILPGQNSVTQSFSVTNNDNIPVIFDLSSVDMGSLDETGGVVFSGLPADYADKYGAAKWVVLSKTSITISPHSTQSISFIVTSNDTLRPGGHYGAIIVKTTDGSRPSENQIKFDPQAAMLLFIRKIGGEIYNLNLEQPKLETKLWTLPDKLQIQLKNNGNVHVVPRGVVKITDSRGRLVGQGIINPESSLVLPERTRGYQTSFPRSSWWRLPGRYKVEIAYRYDGLTEFTFATQSFFFWNLPMLLTTLVGLILLIFTCRFIKQRYGNWLRRKTSAVRLRLAPYIRKISPQKGSSPKHSSVSPPAQTKSYFFWPTHKRGHPTKPPIERQK